jgi:hypothetical protein
MKRMLKPSVWLGAAIFACAMAIHATAQAQPDNSGYYNNYYPHFVPNSQAFWDFSENWTTNYGPAYRDTVEQVSNFLPCTGQYALCFSSGPEPLPCEKSADGRFADCKCTVKTGLNFVLMTGILNAQVYQETVKVCGADGSRCATVPNKAPVCAAIEQGRLIPGADVISTFSQDNASNLAESHSSGAGKPALTICPKAPYAGCMTAPCQMTRGGYAQCSCPVFWGVFQLTEADAQCELGDDLVWSSSYDPTIDTPP